MVIYNCSGISDIWMSFMKLSKNEEDPQRELNGSKPVTRSESFVKRWRRTAVTRCLKGETISTPRRRHSRSEDKYESDVQMLGDSCDKLPILHILALNALDLSAPASDILVKEKGPCEARRRIWIQLSGHPGSLTPAGPGTLWKRLHDCNESEMYEKLMKDSAVGIVPKFYRKLEFKGELFVEIRDLLYDFCDPYVLDIKMGTRTFLESEVSNNVARKDLYLKMKALDPSAPTPEEEKELAVTKLRYMTFREELSSTCEFGFRVEAMKLRGQPVSDLKKVRTKNELTQTFDRFFNGNPKIRRKMLERILDIRRQFENSSFFKSHEVVGSSILMIHDECKVGAWIIDFGKTRKLPDGVGVTHRNPWKPGNHEEGYLFGLDNLIDVVRSACPKK
ncbi:inositol-trisphosphate 3-kinase homolog isoform X2 [Artemia franciscana]|uniref:Kinase n=1 Tax=Artemia franciscana TaxID=6661 RepID=A0AA88I748_ARTSF|nr:hypothetical protein QYM36_002320 [Artemia franciscana]